MTETHTPGPWKVSKHGTPDYAPQYGIHNGGNDFCIVKSHKGDADLIAAAPNLLANAQRLHLHVNGLHCTRRATDADYRASALCAAMDELIRDNAASLQAIR